MSMPLSQTDWSTHLTFRWKVKNFSSRKEEMTSTKFKVLNGSPDRWHVKIRFSDQDGAPASVGACLLMDTSPANLVLTFTLVFEDTNKRVLRSKVLEDVEFSQEKRCWGWRDFMPREELIGQISDFEDVLIVICVIKARPTGDQTNKIKDKLKDYQSLCLTEWSSLVEKENFDQVTLVSSDGKVLQAYKDILISRSSVFETMFNNDMSESRDNKVSISDVDHHTLKLLLSFLYSGRLPLNDLDDGDKINLLATAHKYDVAPLHDIMEKCLMLDVNVDNAVELLISSYLFGCDRLKRNLLKFVTSYEAKGIYSTTEWNAMVQSHPKLLNECFIYAINNEHFDCITE